VAIKYNFPRKNVELTEDGFYRAEHVPRNPLLRAVHRWREVFNRERQKSRYSLHHNSLVACWYCHETDPEVKTSLHRDKRELEGYKNVCKPCAHSIGEELVRQIAMINVESEEKARKFRKKNADK